MKADQWDAYLQHLIDGGAPSLAGISIPWLEDCEPCPGCPGEGCMCERQQYDEATDQEAEGSGASHSDTETTAPDQAH